MSTLTEIEAAIAKLSSAEREVLESRIFARHQWGSLAPLERTELLTSLDEAEAEIDRGESFTSEQMRAAVRTWVGK